jgi:hypothetical protein
MFIFDTDQTQINGEAHATVPLKLSLMMFAVGKSTEDKD